MLRNIIVNDFVGFSAIHADTIIVGVFTEKIHKLKKKEFLNEKGRSCLY